MFLIYNEFDIRLSQRQDWIVNLNNINKNSSFLFDLLFHSTTTIECLVLIQLLHLLLFFLISMIQQLYDFIQQHISSPCIGVHNPPLVNPLALQSEAQSFVGHCDMQQTCGGPGSPIKQPFVKSFPIGLSKLVLNPGPIQFQNFYSCTILFTKL